MPRRLTVVRHAKSDWGEFSLPDFDRPLNDRGLQDASAMGARLHGRGDRPGLIISSPALRAKTTAALLAKELEYSEEDLQLAPTIYEAPVSALLEVAREVPDEIEHVMMVGHNPGSEGFVSFLIGGPCQNLVTCSVVDLDIASRSWKSLGGGDAKLRSVWFPKMFKE